MSTFENIVNEIKAFVLEQFTGTAYYETKEVEIGGVNYTIQLDISLLRVVENTEEGLTPEDFAQNLAITMANLTTSPTFMETVDGSQVKDVTINFKAVPGEASLGQDNFLGDPARGFAQINLADIDKEYLTDGGDWARFNLQHIVNHELTHVFSGLDDGYQHLNLVDDVNAETDGGPSRYSYENVRQVSDEDRLFEYCFAAGTLITLADGRTKVIEDIAVGDMVLSFNEQGDLVSAPVTQLLDNVTTEWLKLSNGTVVTPGHRYLRPDGSFMEIKEIIAGDGRIVAKDGEVMTVTAETAQEMKLAA